MDNPIQCMYMNIMIIATASTGGTYHNIIKHLYVSTKHNIYDYCNHVEITKMYNIIQYTAYSILFSICNSNNIIIK